MDSPSFAPGGSTALLSPAIHVWRELEARQIDAAPIFRAAGVDPATLGVPGKRISTRTSLRLMRSVDGLVADPAFGLDIAQHANATAMHAVNAVPAVCDAPPGLHSTLELPVIRSGIGFASS